MKRYTPSLTSASAVALSSMLISAPLFSLAASSFSIVCGERSAMVESLKDFQKMPFNVACVIPQITTQNLRIQCKGTEGLSISDRNGVREASSSANGNSISIGRYAGQQSRDRFVIHRTGTGALVMTAELDYNNKFARKESMILEQNAASTTCDIFPFSWSDSGGC